MIRSGSGILIILHYRNLFVFQTIKYYRMKPQQFILIFFLIVIITLPGISQDTIHFTQPVEYTDFYGQEDVNSLAMLSEDRFILAYSGGSSMINGKIRVGSIEQDTVINIGNAFAFIEDEAPNEVEAYALSDTSFIVVSNSGFNSEVRVGFVNSNMDVHIENTSTVPAQYNELLVLADTIFIAAYYDSNMGQTKCDLCKINPDFSVSVDSTYSLYDPNLSNDDDFSMDTLSKSTFVLSIGKQRGYTMVGSLDENNVITFSEMQSFSLSTVYFIDVVGLSDKSYAIIFSDVDNSMKGTVVIGSIDVDDHITYSEKFYFSNDETSGFTATLLTAGTLILSYTNTGDGQNAYVVKVSFAENTFVFENGIMYDELSTVSKHPIGRVNNKTFIIMYPELLSTSGYVILGMVTGEVISTSHGLNQEASCSIFPNPADDFLHILYEKKDGPASVQLLDIRGRVVLSRTYDAFPVKLNLSEYDNGVYFLKLENQGRKHIEKVIIY